MLTQEQYATLKAEAAVAGLSMAELVRRALDQVYRPQARLKVRGWEISVAVWRRPDAAVVGRRIHGRPTAREFRTRAAPEPSAANRPTLW